MEKITEFKQVVAQQMRGEGKTEEAQSGSSGGVVVKTDIDSQFICKTVEEMLEVASNENQAMREMQLSLHVYSKVQ